MNGVTTMADLRLKYNTKNFFGIHEYREDNLLNAEYDQFLKAMRYLRTCGKMDSALDFETEWHDDEGYYEKLYYVIYHDDTSFDTDAFVVIKCDGRNTIGEKMTYRQALNFFRKYFVVQF